MPTPPRLSHQTRDRLVTLLADDRLDAAGLLNRLRSLRRLERASTCAGVVYLLTHLCLPEEQAEHLLADMLRHRAEMARSLNRDPGLHVAAADFFANVKRLLANPTIVELDQLEHTERSAFMDALTNLHNRRYFQTALDLEIRRSQRYGLQMALLMLDLDAFKPVNDLYGHPLGDLVLQRTGGIIRMLIRDSDVACRFGGEEFSIILPETGRMGAYSVAERIRGEFQQSFSNEPIEERIVLMTLSGGIACYPQDGGDPTELVARADQALYQAKTRGKNQIITYHAERRRSVRFNLRRSARVGITRSANNDSDQARPVNLSRGGALLSTREGFAIADTVEVTLRGNSRDWVVPGQVVRFEERATTTGRHLVAVAFETLLPRECLFHQIQGVPLGVGAPGQRA